MTLGVVTLRHELTIRVMWWAVPAATTRATRGLRHPVLLAGLDVGN